MQGVQQQVLQAHGPGLLFEEVPMPGAAGQQGLPASCAALFGGREDVEELRLGRHRQPLQLEVLHEPVHLQEARHRRAQVAEGGDLAPGVPRREVRIASIHRGPTNTYDAYTCKQTYKHICTLHVYCMYWCISLYVLYVKARGLVPSPSRPGMPRSPRAALYASESDFGGASLMPSAVSLASTARRL